MCSDTAILPMRFSPLVSGGTSRLRAQSCAFMSTGNAASSPRSNTAIGGLYAITARAMVEGSWNKLKACPGRHCGWVFYDRSRNQSALVLGEGLRRQGEVARLLPAQDTEQG